MKINYSVPMESNSASNTGEFVISKIIVVRYLHNFGKTIWSCRNLPYATKILQNFWLTPVLKPPQHKLYINFDKNLVLTQCPCSNSENTSHSNQMSCFLSTWAVIYIYIYIYVCVCVCVYVCVYNCYILDLWALMGMSHSP